MWHLSLALIFGSLIVTACDGNRPRAITSENLSATEEARTLRTTDNGTFVQEDTTRTYQAQEVTPRDFDKKTYNEKQFSDEASDYPIDKSDKADTYNQKQINP